MYSNPVSQSTVISQCTVTIRKLQNIQNVSDDVTNVHRHVDVTHNTHPVKLGAAAAWVNPGGGAASKNTVELRVFLF